MNIKRIIREELGSISDSFYLLVSDDENFIYGSGKFGSDSFEPVENFDSEGILRSRYQTQEEALKIVSWAEYYKGNDSSPGKSADNILKHNPKVVPVDFILRKRDESFPIIESNDLDWIKDVDPLSGGEYYNDTKAICFGDQQKWCDVRIANGYITFYLNEEEVSKLWGHDGYGWDDDSWIMLGLWRNGTPYDGDGDWHEFDSDEFNYSYYNINNNQKVRFNEILRGVGSDEEVGNFEDSMGSLTKEFKHPVIQDQFDSLVGEYLEKLGYVIQKNRWLSVSHQWDAVCKKTGVDVSLGRGNEIKIQIPIEKAYQKYYNTSEVNDLTQLLKAIIKNLSDIYWYEWFNDEWDTDGADEATEDSFNDFLDKAEDYLDSEKFKKWEKVLSNLEKLNIKNANSYWYNFKQLERENPNQDTIWRIHFKDEFNKADLFLYPKQSKTFYGNEDILEKHDDVPVEEIPKYIKPLD